jgi:hypothetical protein
MKERVIDDSVEAERYELFAQPSYLFHPELERRDFFKLLGGGLVLVFTLDAFASQESGQQGGESGRLSPKNCMFHSVRSVLRWATPI